MPTLNGTEAPSKPPRTEGKANKAVANGGGDGESGLRPRKGKGGRGGRGGGGLKGIGGIATATDGPTGAVFRFSSQTDMVKRAEQFTKSKDAPSKEISEALNTFYGQCKGVFGKSNTDILAGANAAGVCRTQMAALPEPNLPEARLDLPLTLFAKIPIHIIMNKDLYNTVTGCYHIPISGTALLAAISHRLVDEKVSAQDFEFLPERVEVANFSTNMKGFITTAVHANHRLTLLDLPEITGVKPADGKTMSHLRAMHDMPTTELSFGDFWMKAKLKIQNEHKDWAEWKVAAETDIQAKADFDAQKKEADKQKQAHDQQLKDGEKSGGHFGFYTAPMLNRAAIDAFVSFLGQPKNASKTADGDTITELFKQQLTRDGQHKKHGQTYESLVMQPLSNHTSLDACPNKLVFVESFFRQFIDRLNGSDKLTEFNHRYLPHFKLMFGARILHHFENCLLKHWERSDGASEKWEDFCMDLPVNTKDHNEFTNFFLKQWMIEIIARKHKFANTVKATVTTAATATTTAVDVKTPATATEVDTEQAIWKEFATSFVFEDGKPPKICIVGGLKDTVDYISRLCTEVPRHTRVINATYPHAEGLSLAIKSTHKDPLRTSANDGDSPYIVADVFIQLYSAGHDVKPMADDDWKRIPSCMLPSMYYTSEFPQHHRH